MTDAINEAQSERDKVRQAQQGNDPSYGSSSDNFAQPGKSTNANGASAPLDAAADANDTSDTQADGE